MKLLLFSSHSPFDELTGPSTGGGESALRQIAEALAERGHEVHYLAFAEGPARVDLVGDVTVHLHPPDRLGLVRRALAEMVDGALLKSSALARGSFGVDPTHLVHRYRPWRYRRLVFGLIDVYGIEALHCYSSLPDSMIAALAATQRGVATVIRMGGRYWHLRYGRMKNRLRRASYLEELRFVFGNVDVLAYNSPNLETHSQELFRELGIDGVASSACLDIGVRPPPSSLDPLGGSDFSGALVVACVGKFKADSKRQDLIVRAVASLRGRVPVHVVFAGDGPLRQATQELGRDLGIAGHLTFLGNITRPEVFGLFERADAVVHPSEFEGSSRAIAEAMLCGRPIIASDIPATREHVDDGVTGLLVPNTAQGFADALSRLASSRDLRQTLGRQAGRYAADAFDPVKATSLYETLLRDLIEQRREGRQ